MIRNCAIIIKRVGRGVGFSKEGEGAECKLVHQDRAVLFIYVPKMEARGIN